MTVYVMVTTRASQRYTPYAVQSFFEQTTFSDTDQFILIDNDQALTDITDERLSVLKNSEPKGFAANMNQGMRAAIESGQDAVLLNNDLIFTSDWSCNLFREDMSITSALSTREIAYTFEGFSARNPMDLEEYLGNEATLAKMAQFHSSSHDGFLNVLTLPFFAVRIPYRALMEIGLLDESFGNGGGEDYDYCLRAHQNNFKVQYDLSRFILHFGGKSSWSGAESKLEQTDREAHFFRRFKEKWGEKLTDIILHDRLEIIQNDPVLSAQATNGDYAELINLLQGQ